MRYQLEKVNGFSERIFILGKFTILAQKMMLLHLLICTKDFFKEAERYIKILESMNQEIVSMIDPFVSFSVMENTCFKQFLINVHGLIG